MELHGFEVEAEAAAPGDVATAVGSWLVDLFGVLPRLTAVVADLDAATAELAAKGVAAPPLALDTEGARAVRVTGPGGLTVDVVQPAPAGHHEEVIGGFIAGTARLAGPPTVELAAGVASIVAKAWDEIKRLLEGVADDKVLATHLLLSQQSRAEAPDSNAFWQRSAASTLLSGFVGRGPSG